MPEKSSDYVEESNPLFGKIKRPLITIEIFSKTKNLWITVKNVLADTAADVSILPRYLGELIVGNTAAGKYVEIRGIVPFSKLVCYIHNLRFKIDDKEFELPVAISDSDDTPPILGRKDGLDLFFSTFDGKRTNLSWQE